MFTLSAYAAASARTRADDQARAQSINDETTSLACTPAVPPIPSCRMDAAWLRNLDLLLWTRTGRTRVHLTDGEIVDIPAGEGIWLPAGSSTAITTDEGSVAIPHAVPAGFVTDAPSSPLRFAVPSSWQSWLILHFILGSSAHRVFGYPLATLAEAVVAVPSQPTSSSARWTLGEDPPMPRSTGALTVARELRRNPALDHSIEEWARFAACSVSTLRRGFHGTGLTFAQWRTLTRLAIACGLLALGCTVEQAATRVGFTSRHGFTRAFTSHYDLTPNDYAARARASGYVPQPFAEAAAGIGALARLLTASAPVSVAAEAAPLPATHTSWHRNDKHVLTWMLKGRGYLRIGEAEYARDEGDAIWIPAGVDHRAGNFEGSIALPIATVDPSDVSITTPMKAHLPATWEDYLLHRAIATRSVLRPEGFEPRSVLSLFTDQLAAQHARLVPMPCDRRAREVASSFLTEMRLPPGAAIDRTVAAAFLRETGLTWPKWRHGARMRIAADLLRTGATPTAAAQRVGYRRLRSFSRAFRTHFGTSPREFAAEA